MKQGFWIAVVVFSTFCLLAGPDQPVRLAILSESPDAGQAADLLTTEISKNGRVKLLERAEIDKIYREQGWSAANRDYLKLGQILGADGLLLVQASVGDSPQLLNARLVAVQPGVVLVAEQFSVPATNQLEWASSFAGHLSPYLPKLSVLARDAVAISVVNIRAAVASPDAPETERQAKLLMIQRLSRERQLFVGERERMQLLSEENSLRGLDDSTFWNGSYLLEGVLDRAGHTPGRMTIDVRLTPPKGRAPIEFNAKGGQTNLAGLINDLAKQLTTALNVEASAAPWDARDEAGEFFVEANWAYRWGLFAESQAASESAWALGKRSKELAALRIRAYADSVGSVNEHSGNILVPKCPDPEKLPAMTRALELYCQDEPILFTNAVATDPDTLLAGIRLFRLAGSFLDGFYQAAELREGHEGQLADLRRLTRQVWSIVESKAPQLPAEVVSYIRSGRFFRSIPDADRILREQLPMYDLAKWEEGGIIFERPEDSLPLFKQMLEGGYIPTERPRMVGWTWDDRKRVPKIQRRFIEDLCASTNPCIHLDGLCLALISVDFYPEAEFHEREDNLLAAIWDNRAWVYGQADRAAILARAETILRDKYSEPDVNKRFAREPFVSLRQNLRRDYLTMATKVDGTVVDALLNNHFPSATADEARELIPLIDHWTNQDPTIFNTAMAFRRTAKMPTLNSQPPTVKPTFPAADPLTLKFIPWAKSGFETVPNARPQVQRLIFRNNELWMRVRYVTQKGIMPFEGPSAYVAADPVTGQTRTIWFPEELGSPDGGFEIASDSLYVSVQNHLERFRFRTGKWESIAVPMVGGAEITDFGGYLYLATADSLLKVEPQSAAATIVASSRRQPPADAMDLLLSEGNHEFFRAGNSLGLTLGNQAFLWNPGNHDWSRLAEIPLQRSPSKKHFSDQGVLFLTLGLQRHDVIAVWADTNAPELLLEQRFSRGFSNRPSMKELGTPRWKWPEAFPLNSSCWFAENKCLCVLVPRAIRSPFARQPDEPVRFQDDRQATLLYFERSGPNPEAVPIRFEKDGQSMDPFDRDQVELWTFQMEVSPFWLRVPAGFVLACPNLMGHWLVTRPELEKRRAPLPAAVPMVDDSKSQAAKIGGSPP